MFEAMSKIRSGLTVPYHLFRCVCKSKRVGLEICVLVQRIGLGV